MKRKPKAQGQKATKILSSWNPQLKEAAYQLYVQGKSNADISDALGVCESTLKAWASQFEWEARKRSEEVLRTTIRGPAQEMEIAAFSIQILVSRVTKFISRVMDKVEDIEDSADLKDFLVLFDNRLDNVLKLLLQIQDNLIKSRGITGSIEHKFTLADLLEKIDDKKPGSKG